MNKCFFRLCFFCFLLINGVCWGDSITEPISIAYINTATVKAPFMMGANKYNQSFVDFAKQYHIDILLSGVTFADSKDQISDEFTKFINDKKIDEDAINSKLNKNSNVNPQTLKISYINTGKLLDSFHIKDLNKEEQTKLVAELNRKLKIYANQYEIDFIVNSGDSTKIIYVNPEIDITDAFIKSLNNQEGVVANRRGYGITNQVIKYINADKIFRDAPIAIEIQEKLRNKYKDRESALVELSKQVDEGKVEMSVYKAQKDEFSTDLSKDKNYEFKKVLVYANKKIQELALRNEIKFIFQECAFVNPRIDITDDILRN